MADTYAEFDKLLSKKPSITTELNTSLLEEAESLHISVSDSASNNSFNVGSIKVEVL